MSAQPQSHPQQAPRARARVLIVDDDVSILGVVSEVLQDDGYDVVTAGSGEEAIELLHGEEFALVMTDIRLPGINGVKVLEYVREKHPRSNVIMITSHASLDTSINAIKHGAYDYLLKPFEDLTLISSAAKRAVNAYNIDVERSQLIRSLKVTNQELARVNQVLHGLAIRDGLTNLFNHRYINEILAKELADARLEDSVLSLVFVDVDKFKEFNDQHGHHHGDLILRELGALMRENVRKKDFVARWGGEEFVILCPKTDAETATGLAESLRKTIAQHTFMRGEQVAPVKITISAGVSASRHNTTKEQLVESADAALYQAKRNGRNQVRVAQ
jgi:diguanylate cyclase (GGDEF)-like protein